MVKRKTKKSKKKINNYSTRNTIMSIVFIFVWVVSFIRDLDSTLGDLLFTVFSNLFGQNYLFIFAPVSVLLGTLLLIKKD